MTDAAVDEPLVLTEDIGPVRRLTMNRPKALNALNHELIEALVRRVRRGRRGRRGLGRDHPARRRPRVLRRLRPDRGRGRGRAGRPALARGPRRRLDAGMLEILDYPKPVIAQRPLVLPGRRHRPDARVRPGRGGRRRVLRLRRRAVRVGRRLDVPAVGGRRPQGEGAAVHRRGPRAGRRGAADRAGEPRRAARPSWTTRRWRSPRRSRRTSRSSCRRRSARVNRAWDVAGFRAAMAANTELDVDDRDREPARPRRVPPDHERAGPEGRDRRGGTRGSGARA